MVLEFGVVRMVRGYGQVVVSSENQGSRGRAQVKCTVIASTAKIERILKSKKYFNYRKNIKLHSKLHNYANFN